MKKKTLPLAAYTEMHLQTPPKINLGSSECSLYFKAMFLVAYCSFYSFVNLISSNRAMGALPSTYLWKYLFYTVTS